jgi:hypothetical protein
MTQAQLDRRVARATGESLCTIRSRGFSIANPSGVEHDPEPSAAPQVIDWDELAAQRVALFLQKGRSLVVA